MRTGSTRATNIVPLAMPMYSFPCHVPDAESKLARIVTRRRLSYAGSASAKRAAVCAVTAMYGRRPGLWMNALSAAGVLLTFWNRNLADGVVWRVSICHARRA